MSREPLHVPFRFYVAAAGTILLQGLALGAAFKGVIWVAKRLAGP